MKLNIDKTESLLFGSRRRFSLTQDKHLRIATHDISFKLHVKTYSGLHRR